VTRTGPGFLLPALLLAGGCFAGPLARSEQSFDEIASRLDGLTAAEVSRALGPPDSRQPVFLRDERWIWWNFTYLAGENYPPEVRGQVVHLEVTFRNPVVAGDLPRPIEEWRVAHPFGVAYRTLAGRTATPAEVHLPASHGS
jgi:hypothetical protein